MGESLPLVFYDRAKGFGWQEAVGVYEFPQKQQIGASEASLWLNGTIKHSGRHSD